MARLALGPLSIDALAPQIAKALGERFGPRYTFSLGEAAIVRNGLAPALTTGPLSIKDSSGHTILTAPRAEVTIDPLAFVVGRVTPKRLEIFEVELHLALRPNGCLALPGPASPSATDALTLAPSLAAAPTKGRAALPADASIPVPQALPSQAPASPSLAAEPPRSLLVKRLVAAIRLIGETLTDPASPAAAIDRIGIMRGKMVIDDEASNQPIVFNDVDLVFGKASGATKFSLSAGGPNGRWTASGLASGGPGLDRRLVLSVSNLSLDEILLAAGTRTIGADFDMPLSAKLDIRLSADGLLSQAAGEFGFGSGYLRFDDPDDEPLMVDEIAGRFHWDQADRRIIIDGWRLDAAARHFALSGSVAVPVQETDPWLIRLANVEPGVVGAERPGENPIAINQASLAARLYLAERKLVIDRFSLSGPQCGFALAGALDWANGPHLRLGASVSPTPVKTVLRLWPSFVAAAVRSYLLSHTSGGLVEKGTLQIDFDASDLEAMRADRPPPDEKALLDFTISNASLEFLPGVPPLKAIDGAGHVTGRTAAFTVLSAVEHSGNGRTLSLSDGRFHVADTSVKPIQAVIAAKVSGSVEAIGQLLSYESLKPYASLPLDPATLTGQADGTLEIGMKLGPHTGPDATALSVNATVANFAADKLIGSAKLEAATLAVTVDPAGLRATGQGRMFGAPAAITMEKLTGKPAEASIGLTFDEDARARLGFAIPGVTGLVGAKVAAPIGTGEKPRARVELDLAGAAIDIPGISKPAGRPGKLSFFLAANDAGATLDSLAVDVGSVQARGKADLGAGFSLLAASFPQVKFSPGDDMRVDAVGAGETVKVMVRGNAIDARPFLKSLIYSPPGTGALAEGNTDSRNAQAAAKAIEFDVRSGVVSGFNKQAISGAELHFAKRGSQIKQFSFAGTFAGQPVSCNLTGGAISPQLNLISEDAGWLLSFLDLYRHMEGGRLSAGMILGQDELLGVLVINDFVLRGEPALQRLVSEAAPPLDSMGRPQKIDTSAVAFNKLQVRFQRDGSRLVLSDGTMNGDAIGLTVDGAIDFVRDNVDMRGTFVPIYAFNNMFARIPLVGLILGGGSAEQGLIGVNYRISGLASAPTLTINPLSAMAPGIFRQILGAVDFDPMRPLQ